MRAEPNPLVEHYRRQIAGRLAPFGANWGFFQYKTVNIMSSGTPEKDDPTYPWEHVSVSAKGRCPTWEEMQAVKELFWRDDETVVQFHPCKAEYVNNHEYCLHLWKRAGERIELPPRICL